MGGGECTRLYAIDAVVQGSKPGTPLSSDRRARTWSKLLSQDRPDMHSTGATLRPRCCFRFYTRSFAFRRGAAICATLDYTAVLIIILHLIANAISAVSVVARSGGDFKRDTLYS